MFLNKLLDNLAALWYSLQNMLGSREVLGLDIGSNCIKAVQLKETKTGYELQLFDTLSISPDLIVDGSVIDALRLADALKEIARKTKIKTRDVVISVAGHSSVIIKRIALPEMTEEVLSESIRFEAEQYVPFNIEDVNLDFQILGPGEEKGQIDVMLVAVKKDTINEYASVVKEAGFNAVVVDVDAFALENMYGINYEVEPDTNIALLNIGASSINLNIMRGGLSEFIRDSSVGGNVITEALQKEFGLTYEDAERLKKGGAIEKVMPEQADEVITQALSSILSEVSRSFDFFKSSAAYPEIKEVILSGGGALIKGLPDLLSERLGIEVRLAQPFNSVKIPSKFDTFHIEESAPMAAVAVGLAMRRVGDR